jgi:hypothetical protein
VRRASSTRRSQRGADAVAANFHASADGERVVNYAQWESADAFRAMLADPAAREHIDAARRLAEHADPRLYTVDSVHYRR